MPLISGSGVREVHRTFKTLLYNAGMLSWFVYDFGYSWPFTLGHLLVGAIGLAIAAFAYWRGWRRWVTVVAAVFALWGGAGAVAMHA